MIDGIKRFLVCLLLVLPLVSLAQVTADFSADNTTGCGALGVQFTDLSTGNITSRTWTFGNGNTSSLVSPFENYGIGVYTVSLTVSDGVNSDTETKTSYIRVFANPTADFNFNPSSGCTPLPVTFTSTSTVGGSPITTYIWDTKDGSSSPNAASFTHTYQGGGPYIPSLQVIDGNGCSDSKLATSNITPTPSPVAAFSTQASPVGCAVPFNVDFVNNSTGVNLTYQWNFGDGGTSTQANPSHTYNSLGTYNVSLTVTDPNCSDSEVKTNFVQIQNTQADFTTTNDTFCFGDVVRFTNTSVGASSFSWDFDDGSPRSFARNPAHIFLDSGWFDITLIASAGSACIDQIIKSIYIQKVEADFIVQPAFSCQLPDTIQFFSRSFRDFSYEWRIPDHDKDNKDTTFVYTSRDPFHVMRDTGNFNDTLIIRSEFGCADSAFRSIRRGERLVTRVLVTGDKGTSDNYGGCLPLTVTFTDTTYGSGNITSYLWDLGGGVTFSGRFPPPQTYDTAGVFNVVLTVTNDSGCVDVDSAAIFALEKDDPAFTVSPDTVCQGDTVTIQMTNSAGNIYEFGIFTPRFGQGYTEDAVNFGQFNRYLDTGYYSASVKVGVICDTVLIIDSAFYVLGPVSSPAYRAFDCNNPLQVEFQGNIFGETRFYWDFGDGSPLDSVNKNPIHTFPSPNIYTVILKSYNDTNRCPFQEDTLQVDVIPRLPPSQLPYQKYHCRDGNFLRLYYNNTNKYDSSLWYLNGSYLGNFEDQDFSKDIFINGRNQVVLVAVDRLGCKDTINDFVFISDPRANFTSNVSGGCIPFNVQMLDNSITDTTILTWEWLFSNLPNDTFRIQNPVINVNTTSDIRIKLTIKDFIGCVADTTIDDLISGGNLNVDFSTADDLNICVGESIQFFNRSSGSNITSIWNFDDGTIDTINTVSVQHQFDSAGLFDIKLVVIDQSGCRDTLERYQVNVEALPIARFVADDSLASCYPFAVNFSDRSTGNVVAWQWDLGGNDSIVFQNPFRNYISPGNFDVSLIVETANGCRDTLLKQDYIQITGPTATFDMSDDVVCLNEPVTFTITSQNGVGSFRWAFGDGNSSVLNPATHSYTDTSGLVQPSLIIRDVIGNCEVVIIDSIVIREVIAKFSLDDTSGCEPFSPVITNLMQGEDSFSWDLGDGRTSTDREPVLTYDQRGNYDLKLSISSNIGCSDESIVTVNVFETPVAQVNGNTSICLDDSTTLTASGGTLFEWYKGDQLITTNASIKIGPDTTTNYTVIVGNQFDCYDTTSVEVYVQQRPNYMAIDDSTIIIGEEINMNAYAGLGFTYSWRPSTGLSCNNCPDPVAQPLASTNYILEITDPNGCFNLRDTIRITVREEFTLDVPQAFSPNGDGINDIIYAKGWGLKTLIAFKIYNRFGELIFESNDFDKGWDGTYNGKDQMIETYVYTVEAETYKGVVLQKKGNITLLR